MKIFSISDIHIRSRSDERYIHLISILNSNFVKECETLVFLGDIFDLMVGEFPQYIQEFPEFFELLGHQLSKGKAIYFVEGNHDFHLKAVFEKALGHHTRFHYRVGPFFLKCYGHNILFAHGDEIEMSNRSHLFFRKFVGGGLIKLLLRDLFSYSFLKKIGEKMSQMSRKHNSRRYGSSLMALEIKEKFRKSALQIFKTYGEKAKLLIAGHSHQRDHFFHKNFQYMNNGFFPVDRCFIIIKINEEGVKSSFNELVR